MALNDWERFKGVTALGRDLLNQNLLYSLIDWFQWSTLQIGGFQNVTLESSGLYGGDYSRLRPVQDPNFTNGQVWEGFRSDWVWETGIYYDTQPIQATGVYVDNVYYPTSSTTGAYAHYIDFIGGRIVFNTAISTSKVVRAEFSHRTVNYVKATEPWFQELLFDSYRINRGDFLTSSSGQWHQLSKTRKSLPVVGMELVDRVDFKPYELGGGQYVYQDVMFYVLTDNEDDRNQLVDIISLQNNKTIWMYNKALIKESPSYPLNIDYRGTLVDDPMQYPQIIAPTGDGGFAWRTATFSKTRVGYMQPVNRWLHRGYVRCTMEIIMGNI